MTNRCSSTMVKKYHPLEERHLSNPTEEYFTALGGSVCTEYAGETLINHQDFRQHRFWRVKPMLFTPAF